jgi:putative tricarboxylic transport membrane protein
VVTQRFNFPAVPVVIGMILSPLAEAQLRNAMSIGEGSAMVFVHGPLPLILMMVVLAVRQLRLAKRWIAPQTWPSQAEETAC